MNEDAADSVRPAGLWTLLVGTVALGTTFDWWSKSAAVDYHIRECGLLAQHSGIEVFDTGWIRLHLVREYNSGMAFGLLQDFESAPMYLALMRAAAIFVMLWIFQSISRKTWLQALAFASLIAGAAGNLLDNLFHRELGHESSVRDFILLSFGDWTFPAFNIADVFVTVGATLLCFALRSRAR